jgi:uncharacterized protein
MTADPRLVVETLAARLGAQVIETHISWVLLVGDTAYKLKKPVRLPFVDYSSLERRHHFCEEEVRLNRRLAAGLYLGVSRVSGPPHAPDIDGPGDTLDYAVRMRRFPQEALFSAQAAAGTLNEADVDRFAQRLAAFHEGAPVSRQAGSPASDLAHRMHAVLEASAPLLGGAEREELASWIAAQAASVAPLWAARRAAGHVREGHGDLHLANILSLDGDVMAFDCIEFDVGLRCIDVIEEVAFPLMDFAAHGVPGLGWRFLDAWLERTGDHEGLPGLRLCVVYRALVRAMAEHLRQPHSARAHRYAAQALQWARGTPPRLFITFGLPGSGKTFASQRLLQARGAIRIRSDVERKRLFGLDALARSQAQGLSIYTPEATRLTYGRLLSLAAALLAAGLSVVLDAAFLRRDERRQARAVADAAGVPFTIVACEAPAAVLRQRLAARIGDASEADAAVLDRLASAVEPLDASELPECAQRDDG